MKSFLAGWTATAILIGACAWDATQPAAFKPVAGNPCGNLGVPCSNGMCCDEGETCGGNPGCPAGYCCNVRTPPVFEVQHPMTDAGSR